jgi:hypothetical protein
MSYRFADSLRAGSGWNILILQWKTPDDGQRNRPKRAEIHSKNESFEKLVHIVGSMIRN